MSDLTALFADAWREEIAKRQEQSPSFTPDQYVATGRAAAQYGGKRNEDWWLEEGPKMAQRWVDWRKEQGWRLWEPTPGEPAIELSCNFTLPGDIYVVTYIDRVFVTPVGELVIVDIKSGRTPETPEQLGVYATAIEAVHGVRPSWGYWWDAQKGQHSQPFLLDQYTPEYLANIFEATIAGVNAGSFLARPANNCKAWCGTARYCAATGGELAHQYDPDLQVSK